MGYLQETWYVKYQGTSVSQRNILTGSDFWPSVFYSASISKKLQFITDVY